MRKKDGVKSQCILVDRLGETALPIVNMVYTWYEVPGVKPFRTEKRIPHKLTSLSPITWEQLKVNSIKGLTSSSR